MIVGLTELKSSFLISLLGSAVEELVFKDGTLFSSSRLIPPFVSSCFGTLVFFFG